MSNTIKDLSVSFSSPIDFEVEWHSSRFDKWYQSQGHGFESRECYCEEGIVWRTTIWLSTTTLKTGPHGVILNVIKDLNVSSSSPIGFEVEWHRSWSDRGKFWQIHHWITSSSYILHACKISRKLKINNYVINKLFKLQVFIV